MDSTLIETARAWLDGDPDPETRRELAALVDGGDEAALRERFAAPLTFGTAGLRGLVGAGPSRMNRAVVIRATRAVAEHLAVHVRDAKTRPVIVGFDGRLSSRSLAEATIGVLAAARIPVRYFPEPVPTPVAAYGILQLQASACIVITASHNPGEYNGYKLYAENGAQIIPPADEDVEARILKLPPAKEIPTLPFSLGQTTDLVSPVPATLVDRYLADVEAVRPHTDGDRSLRIAYTPLHGVGGRIALRALAAAGFSDVVVVAEQAEPDGHFPTVRFPNPEDPKTLALALALAKEKDADLVLANDPDADRLAVAVRTPAGRYLPLTGNQIGVLLADFMLARAAKAPQPIVLQSIVSSPMTAAVAASHGARFEQTLTGFKWVWNAAMRLEETSSVRFAFGFEEAIGFSVGRLVRDKDGISAAVVFAELAAEARAKETTVLERLEALYRTHGVWVSAQSTVTREGVQGAKEIAAAVDRAARNPPTAVGGVPVKSVTDFRSGGDARPPWLGETPLIVLDLGDAGRALLRPSGTEPKLKVYVDLRGDVPEGTAVSKVEEALFERARAMAKEVVGAIGF
ncbi:MAG TPA: phospho-sugar mutase [Polyangiaceae bacterium]|nr:phospho-sugar mutase [Polyangiaceae bacterium]